MLLLRYIPNNSKIPFMHFRLWVLPISILLLFASIWAWAHFGLNFGIDFRGGTLIEIQTKESGAADLTAIREELAALKIGEIQVQQFGTPDDVLIRIGQTEGGEQSQNAAIDKVKATFGDRVDYRRIELVGPRVSGELTYTGLLGLGVSLLAILIYVWFRFEYQFAVGAIIATLHDLMLTMGMFAVLQMDFSLQSIAALLTIVGYSLNDTVVVYDRIREMLRKYKTMPLGDVIDRSINETLIRTTMTSFTTLIALTSLYIFGGEVIRSFTFAMIFGVAVGTFSSIFIASPILIYLNLRPEQLNKEPKEEKFKAKTKAKAKA